MVLNGTDGDVRRSCMEQPPSKTGFNLGGQALIEGVLMRSPHFVAAAVRRADGSIETRVERFDSILLRWKWLRLPLLRGSVALVEMMMLGMRYLNWSAQLAMLDSEAPPRTANASAEPAHDGVPSFTTSTRAANGSSAKPVMPATTVQDTRSH
jgi:hypothetical protein